ncbi:sulfurtransferase [Sansalvadorimonas verongulae]|uniref:sulfurtransferase n=1 Tax=Sansalvadorimonas verongulae TaxID=2172824 RepID=UPI0012BBA3E6|nr:sulfurtransferase [Sansalvadorimonas verongulae]MTI14281.1 sulfurtransferase [Sansalvadorimonas verongulae]
MDVLIDAATLAQWLGETDEKLVVFDVRYSLQDGEAGQRAYDQGHIAGAQYISLSHDLSSDVIPDKTSRHPLPTPEAFIARVQSWGITEGCRVVLYDAGDQFIAPRMWWMLSQWFGLTNVFILHGGVRAWEQGGFELVTDVPVVEASSFTPSVNDGVLVQAGGVLPFVEKGGTLLDARALERFAGEVEPLDSVGGHIPGAHCQPCSKNVDDNGLFLSSTQLQRLYGVYEGRDVVCYCGSGVSACQNILAMTLAGLPAPRLYAGSWSEWVTDPSRPIAKGR